MWTRPALPPPPALVPAAGRAYSLWLLGKTLADASRSAPGTFGIL